MRKLLLATTVIAAGAVISGPSHANDYYDITHYGLSHGLSDTLYSPLLDEGTKTSEATLSGEIQLNYVGLGSPLDVFCTDIKHDLQETGWFTTAPFGTGQDDPHYTTAQGEEIGWLIGNYKPANQGSMSANQFSSATQLAIWSLEYATTASGASTATNAWDNSDITQDGEFAYNSNDNALNGSNGDVQKLIGAALLAYSGGSALTNPTELLPTDGDNEPIDLSKNQAQSFIPVGGFNNGECDATSCPEPRSLALLGSGLLALGLVRRKRRG